MRYGIEGVLNDFLVDLGRESPQVFGRFAINARNALGSSRLKLKDEHFPAVLKQLKNMTSAITS